MSLLDGLLLDPHRDPREVWIALRADGQKGSGTIADPYDGSKTVGPPMAASLTLKWNEFVVNLGDIELNLPGFDMDTTKLRFVGVTGPAKDWFNFGGDGNEFRFVEVSRYQTISGAPSALGYILEPDVPPPGPPIAPPNVQFTSTGLYIFAEYDYTQGGMQKTYSVRCTIVWPVAKVTFPTAHGLVNLDAVELSGFAGNNSHFNGTYVVEGRTDNSVRIRLSNRLTEDPGPDITTPLSCVVRKFIFRFDELMRSVPEYAVIHLGPGTFETRGYAPAYASSQTDPRERFVGFILGFGQRLQGSGIGATVLQLALPVDEINNAVPIGTGYGSDFAEVADLTVDGNAPGHPIPYRIFPAPATCGGVNLSGSFIALRRVRAINFCTQSVAECFALSVAGLVNPTPAKYVPSGTFNVVEDCIVERPGENNTHETTLLSSSGDHYGGGRSPIVRHNFVNCEYSTGSSEIVAVDSYTREADGHHFTLTTKRPHHRVFGQNIRLNDAKLASEPDPFRPFLQDSFEITAVASSLQLTCYSRGIIPTGPLIVLGYIGVDFHGPAALGGTGCVTESNALYDCYNAFYSDTGATRDAVVRDNYYSDVLSAMRFDYSAGTGGEVPFRHGSSLKREEGNHRIAKFETSTAHLVSPGLMVTVDGARVNTNPNNPYNGNHRVITVSADASGVPRYFYYEMKEVPDPDQDADPPDEENDKPILFQVRWQNPRHSFEGNNYDLYAYDAKWPFQSSGLGTIANRPPPPISVPVGDPFQFPDIHIRENTLRLRDAAAGQSAANGRDAYACRLDNFENTLIEENLINLPGPFQIHYLHSQVVHAFNNRTPAGGLEPLFEDTSGFGDLSGFRRESGLDDRIDDALILSLI